MKIKIFYLFTGQIILKHLKDKIKIIQKMLKNKYNKFLNFINSKFKIKYNKK